VCTYTYYMCAHFTHIYYTHILYVCTLYTHTLYKFEGDSEKTEQCGQDTFAEIKKNPPHHKTALYIPNTALHIRKRALYIRKRDLYICVYLVRLRATRLYELPDVFTRVNTAWQTKISAKQPSKSAKQPSTFVKQPSMPAKEHCIPTKESCISAKEPYMCVHTSQD